MNFKYKLFILLLFLTSIPGYSQIHDTTDMRASYSATLIITGDATYNVKKMQLSVFSGEDLLRGPVTIDTVSQFAIDAALQQAAKDVATSVISAMVSDAAASYVPYVGWAYSALNVALLVGSTENVQYRNYYMTAPAAGWYTFYTWVPGDWTQPDSMIKIFSINDAGSETQLYNYDQVAVSDRTITSRVYLPRGLCHVSVAVGSGTLKTHTAGHLQAAYLDNPDPVQWILPRVPITVQTVGLLNYLPSVGSSRDFNVMYSIPPTPSNILDGTVSYSNIHPIQAIFPADATNANLRVDVWDPNDEATLAQLGTWPYLNMKAIQVGNVIDLGNGGTWTITRQADYITNTIVRGVFHVTP